MCIHYPDTLSILFCLAVQRIVFHYILHYVCVFVLSVPSTILCYGLGHGLKPASMLAYVSPCYCCAKLVTDCTVLYCLITHNDCSCCLIDLSTLAKLFAMPCLL